MENTQQTETNVIEGQFTEVEEYVTPSVEANLNDVSEIPAETVADEQSSPDVNEGEAAQDAGEAVTDQPQPQPVHFIGNVILPPETSALVNVLLNHTLTVLGETGAMAKFENVNDYLGYIKQKMTDLFYTIFPAGAITEIQAVFDEEKNQIAVGVKVNNDGMLEVYSDRVQVATFVKYR